MVWFFYIVVHQICIQIDENVMFLVNLYIWLVFEGMCVIEELKENEKYEWFLYLKKGDMNGSRVKPTDIICVQQRLMFAS